MDKLPAETLVSICKCLANDVTISAVEAMTSPNSVVGQCVMSVQQSPERALLKLSLTSRRHYYVAIMFLYEQISIMSAKRLVRLFFHFIDKPSDALAVRTLSIGVALDLDDIAFEALQEFSALSKARGYCMDGSTALTCPNRWYPVVKSPVDMAIFTLTNQLLFSTKNLVSVSFVLPHNRKWRDNNSDTIVGKRNVHWKSWNAESGILASRNFLPNLQELQLLSYGHKWEQGSRDNDLRGTLESMAWSMIHGFKMPSLRRLKISCDDNYWHNFRAPSCLTTFTGSQQRYRLAPGTGPSQLEHVELLQSRARPKDLRSICFGSSNLRTLIIEMVSINAPNLKESLSSWAPVDVQIALRRVANTLEHFHLTMPRNEATELLAGSGGVFAQYLADMKKLKSWSVVLVDDDTKTHQETEE